MTAIDGWVCTSELRWMNYTVRLRNLTMRPGSPSMTLPDKRVQQQKWVRDTGEFEWRDIPEVFDRDDEGDGA